jgi:hypothetical protein
MHTFIHTTYMTNVYIQSSNASQCKWPHRCVARGALRKHGNAAMVGRSDRSSRRMRGGRGWRWWRRVALVVESLDRTVPPTRRQAGGVGQPRAARRHGGPTPARAHFGAGDGHVDRRTRISAVREAGRAVLLVREAALRRIGATVRLVVAAEDGGGLTPSLGWVGGGGRAVRGQLHQLAVAVASQYFLARTDGT